ncbi:hypothetical protein CBI74_06610 [Salmonella enterica]|nr:hypothetical protein CBI74_06610 [Salmonella enterica]
MFGGNLARSSRSCHLASAGIVNQRNLDQIIQLIILGLKEKLLNALIIQVIGGYLSIGQIIGILAHIVTLVELIQILLAANRIIFLFFPLTLGIKEEKMSL